MSIEFESLFRFAPHPYLVVSPELHVLDANTSYVRKLATHIDALVGRRVTDVVPMLLRDASGDVERALRESLERVLEQREPDSIGLRSYVLQAKDAEEVRTLRLCNTPLLDDAGAVTSILHSVDDYSDLTLPSEYLSSMSHELRTPMNSILGFAQLLARDSKEPLTSRHRERVGHILQSGEHLLRLIDDVLDLARVESGHIPISAEPVDLHDLLAELVRTLAPMASERSVQLDLKMLAPDISYMLCDRVRLLQILMNFGSNAIKYNHSQGRVTFSAEESGAYIRIQVEDTGIGIAVDQQSKLFQAFHRAGQEAGPIEGTGIGLLITKKLAEIMDGRVGFESTPSRGSVFWVELPLSAAGAPTHAQSARPISHAPLAHSARGIVLYVEDNPANIAFMCDLFEDLEGMKLVTARTAAEGVLLTRSLRPQVILMDINLPDMSGSQALHALQKSPDTARIPVIALTAAASERDRRAGLQAGFYRYLTKPLDVDQLMKALDSALRHASVKRQSSSPPSYG